MFLLVAVNAKYIHSNPAVYSLKAYAGEELQPYIDLAEYTINNRKEEILADIYGRKPEVIGFSCYIWNWNMIRELLVDLPKVLPDTVIWLGGPEVSFESEKVLEQFPMVTGIMVGEGEETFRELAGMYAANDGMAQAQEHLTQCRGLYLRTGYTGDREPLSMDDLPFLYHDLDPFDHKIIYYESSRGCPYRCSYCLSSIDKRVRLRSLELIKKELQFFLDRNVSQVKFIDRTFNCNREHAMSIWQFIQEHDNGVTNFHFEISADILREEEIQILNRMRPGLVQLEIGVQSVRPETIKSVNRSMDVERLERNVQAIHQGANVHQHLDLIAGLPYEDYESFGHSFDRVYGMKPQQLQLGFLKVLKGSELFVRAEEFGIRYMENPPYEVLYTKWLSYEDVLRLKRVEELVEIYYNSNQYTHTLPFLEQVFESPFKMYEAMADYFAEKNFFVNSPARAYRYEILLQFAVLHDPEREAVYRELLTYDMYLRENLKSRPSFAAEFTPEHKQWIRSFYQKEEEERTLLPAYGQYDWKQMSKMTHTELFQFAVWKGAQAEPLEHTAYVLFDYERRNPLNREAHHHVGFLYQH